MDQHVLDDGFLETTIAPLNVAPDTDTPVETLRSRYVDNGFGGLTRHGVLAIRDGGAQTIELLAWPTLAATWEVDVPGDLGDPEDIFASIVLTSPTGMVILPPPIDGVVLYAFA